MQNNSNSTSSAQEWTCSICGHVHKGEAPPDFCPLCHAPGSKYMSSSV